MVAMAVYRRNTTIGEFCHKYNMDMRNLASRLGVSDKSVRRWAMARKPAKLVSLALDGLVMEMRCYKPFKQRVLEERDALIVEEYRRGVYVKDIAHKFNVSNSIVCIAAKRAGLTRKPNAVVVSSYLHIKRSGDQ